MGESDAGGQCGGDWRGGEGLMTRQSLLKVTPRGAQARTRGGGGGGRLAGPEYYFSSSTIWAHVPVLTGGEIGICFTDPGGNINESFTGPGLFFHWPEGGGERVGRGGGGGVCAGCPTDGGGP